MTSENSWKVSHGRETYIDVQGGSVTVVDTAMGGGPVTTWVDEGVLWMRHEDGALTAHI